MDDRSGTVCVGLTKVLLKRNVVMVFVGEVLGGCKVGDNFALAGASERVLGSYSKIVLVEDMGFEEIPSAVKVVCVLRQLSECVADGILEGGGVGVVMVLGESLLQPEFPCGPSGLNVCKFGGEREKEKGWEWATGG